MIVYGFTNGGYVAHKIYIAETSMKLSAWYSNDGRLIDCEGMDKLGRSRPVSDSARAKLVSMFDRVVIVYKATN